MQPVLVPYAFLCDSKPLLTINRFERWPKALRREPAKNRRLRKMLPQEIMRFVLTECGRMRWLALFSFLFIVVASAHAQTAESTDASPAQPAAPKLDVDVGSLPSVHRTVPNLDSQPAKPNDSLLTGIDLGGSKLHFEGDRKPPENRVGAETFAPGTLVQSQKSRQIGPTFFGLSIKKSLQ